MGTYVTLPGGGGGGGGAENLDDLTDVDTVTDPPDDEDVLAYDSGTGKWMPATLNMGIADPGGANDDFLQRKAGAWTNRTVAQVKADLGSPSSIPRFYEDDIYSGLMGFNHASIGGGGSALVYGQNLLVLWRIMPVQDVTIDGVQFLVNTDGGSGALARVGIYGQASTTSPTGAPLVDSGTIGVNVSNGTVVTAAITATALSAFTPYWGAFVTNSATLSVRWLANGISNTIRAGSIDAGQVNTSNHSLRRVAHTFGALPSSPTAPFTTAYADIPGVLWKVQV